MAKAKNKAAATDDAASQMAVVKAVYEDGMAEINGTEYVFGKVNHKIRRKIYAFYTGIAQEVQRGSFEFLDRPDYQSIENVIGDNILVNDMQISKIPGYWDNKPEDYLKLITTSMAVFSYPFLRGNAGS